MAELCFMPILQFLDDSGNPVANGHVHTYETGTATAKATYTDAGGGTPNANPVVLDAGGRATIYCGTGAYRFVVQDSLGATIDTIDNITTSPVGDTAGTAYTVQRIKSTGYGIEDSTIIDNGTTVAIKTNLVISKSTYDLMDITGTAAGGLYLSANASSAGVVVRSTSGTVSLTANNGNTTVNVGTAGFYLNCATLFNSIQTVGAGGIDSNNAVAVDATGKCVAKLTPTGTDNDYYALTGTPVDGQVLAIHNLSATYTAYISGQVIANGTSGLFMYVGSPASEWRRVI